MSGRLFSFFYSQPWMRVLVALGASKERSIRELADLCTLPVSTTHDVVRKLEEERIVVKRNRGNKVFYQLSLNRDEEALLTELIERRRRRTLQESAEALSTRAKAFIDWVEDTKGALDVARQSRE